MASDAELLDVARRAAAALVEAKVAEALASAQFEAARGARMRLGHDFDQAVKALTDNFISLLEH